MEGHIGLLCENCDRINRYSFDSTSGKCKKCSKETYPIMLKMTALFFIVVLFLFNQIYGLTMRINKKLLYKGFIAVFDLPFERVN